MSLLQINKRNLRLKICQTNYQICNTIEWGVSNDSLFGKTHRKVMQTMDAANYVVQHLQNLCNIPRVERVLLNKKKSWCAMCLLKNKQKREG